VSDFWAPALEICSRTGWIFESFVCLAAQQASLTGFAAIVYFLGRYVKDYGSSLNGLHISHNTSIRAVLLSLSP
jgi:hypothetical protein